MFGAVSSLWHLHRRAELFCRPQKAAKKMLQSIGVRYETRNSKIIRRNRTLSIINVVFKLKDENKLAVLCLEYELGNGGFIGLENYYSLCF